MFVFCSKSANVKVLAGALGISAGVMIFVSFGEIFGVKAIDSFEEIEGTNRDEASRYATFCFFGGIATTYLLDFLVHVIARVHEQRTSDKILMQCSVCQKDTLEHFGTIGSRLADINRRQSQSDISLGTVEVEANNEREPQLMIQRKNSGSTTSQHQDQMRRSALNNHEQNNHASNVDLQNVDLSSVPHTPLDAQDRVALKNVGTLTAVAIAIHNFPEGLATFMAALADEKLGVALAIAVAIHNITEGICVAMPVYYATGSKWKGFWWSFISGVTELLGALVGYFIMKSNDMSARAYGLLFGIVSGMMVYISLRELVPTALRYDPKDKFVTNCIFMAWLLRSCSLKYKSDQ